MCSMRVITLFLFYCILNKISTQETIETEPKMVKLIGNLISTADKSTNAVEIEKWLQKPLSDLKNQCKDQNEDKLEEKLLAYNEVLINITSFDQKKNHTSGYHHEMALDLWKNMLEFVSYTVQNCLKEGGFNWNAKDKFYLMSTVLKEIVKRMTTVNHLTAADYECSDKMSPEIWACKQTLELTKEESLFSVLLGELKPSFGRCEENLSVKKCVLGVYKKCSKKFFNVYKLMLSPPGYAFPCKNLENL